MSKADLENAKALYPSCNMGYEEWVTFFRTSAGLAAMGRIIYDVYDELISAKERESGTRRIGRRPARSAVTLREVMNVVRPDEFTNEPLSVSLPPLFRGRSQRAFCRRVPVAQGYFSLILAGKREPSLELLERIADVAGVQPWHFPEWRRLYIAELIGEVFRDQPHLAIAAVKSLRHERQKYDLARR